MEYLFSQGNNKGKLLSLVQAHLLALEEGHYENITIES